MKFRYLAAAVLPLTLFVSACEKTDTDLVLDFVNSWLEARGAMAKGEDGTYKPTLKGVGVAMGFATTGDDQADAAMQSGKMVKEIAENDKLVKEGEEAYNKSPPDTKTAKEKLDAAVENRPDDWYYRNHRAYMHLRSGNDAAAKGDFQAGISGCGGNANCLAALHRDRVAFYQNMQLGAFMMADSTMRSCGIVSVGAESYRALAEYATGGEKAEYLKAAYSAEEQMQGAC